jgi:hypothetical protein
MRILMVLGLLVLGLGCGDDGGYEPCAGLTCGDECRLCDPADDECVETGVVKRCDVAGVCSATPVTCPSADDQ